MYDPETGVWKGFYTFYYNAEKKEWTNSTISSTSIRYKDENNNTKNIDDPDFINACTITLDEALAMNLDQNTSADPEEFLIYDSTVEPGTPGTNN